MQGVQIALRAAMSYREVSPLVLAACVGVARATVYRWMRGEHQLALAEASAIAECLDIPGEMLIRTPSTLQEATRMIIAWDDRPTPDAPAPAPDEMTRLAGATPNPRPGSRRRAGTGGT